MFRIVIVIFGRENAYGCIVYISVVVELPVFCLSPWRLIKVTPLWSQCWKCSQCIVAVYCGSVLWHIVAVSCVSVLFQCLGVSVLWQCIVAVFGGSVLWHCLVAVYCGSFVVTKNASSSRPPRVRPKPLLIEFILLQKGSQRFIYYYLSLVKRVCT